MAIPIARSSYAAVIVTFNPAIARLTALMKSLRFISGHRYLVDNASENAKEIQFLAKQFGFIYLQNAQNDGIAKALNVFEGALPVDIEAFIAFDQDSIPRIDYCDSVFNRLSTTQGSTSLVAAVGGLIIDTPDQRPLKFVHIGWLGVTELDASRGEVQPDYLIISGTIISRRAFRESGGFDEQLFVDNVDVEWSYRVAAMGYHLIGTYISSMLHCIGDSELRIPWTTVKLNIHQPPRVRFMTKSRFLSYRKATLPKPWKLHDFIRFCAKSLLMLTLGDQRKLMLSAVVHGALEGLGENVISGHKTRLHSKGRNPSAGIR
jgi:rhamnosyltransferase